MNTTSEGLQQAWQRQALDAPRISLEYLRHRTGRLRRQALLRNGFEYVLGFAGLALVVWRTWDFFITRPLSTTAVVLWIAGWLYIMAQWHRRAGAPKAAAELGTLDALRFYRRELERQRDARRGNWRWWLPPLVPCLLLTFAALLTEVQPTPWNVIGLLALGIVGSVSLGVIGYERDARGFQEEIDALESMARESQAATESPRPSSGNQH